MGWRFFCFFTRNVYLCSIIRLSTYKTNKKMRKTIITMLFACAALFTFNACVVSEQKLTEKVQEAIIDAEKQDGNKLEITEFDLGEKTGKDYKGVLKGTLNGESVVYDVTVNDEGSDFDINWELRK